MERVTELEHYRWANDRSPSGNPVSTAREATSTAYRWTGTQQPSEAVDDVRSAQEINPVVAPKRRAQTRTDVQHEKRNNGAETIHPKRTVPSMVRFTPDEFLIVAERARECGRPPARYIREAALGAVPKAKKTAGSAELIRELSAIGNALQELRILAGGAACESVAEGCEMVLLDVLDVIRRIG